MPGIEPHFLDVQPLALYSTVKFSHISLFLHDNYCEITKTGVARPKFLISVKRREFIAEKNVMSILHTVLHVYLQTETTTINTFTNITFKTAT